MHRYLAVVLCVLGLSAPAVAQKTPFFPYPLQVTKLDNGLTVVRVPFDSPGLVSYNTVVRVGSRNEVEANHTGFAHFFEHMMFKGHEELPRGRAREAARHLRLQRQRVHHRTTSPSTTRSARTTRSSSS